MKARPQKLKKRVCKSILKALCHLITYKHVHTRTRQTETHHSTPHHTTVHHIIPQYTTPQYTTPYHSTPHHSTPHHTTVHHTTVHHTTPHHTTPHHIASHHITSHYAYSHTCTQVTRFYLRFPQFLGAWRVPLRGLLFWSEHLGPDALPDVTNGMRWALNHVGLSRLHYR